MAEALTWGGELTATLIHGTDGDYIAPPIVLDHKGDVVMGREILEAVVESGVTIEHPVIIDCTPQQVADLEQKLARMSATLGVPIGPANEVREAYDDLVTQGREVVEAFANDDGRSSRLSDAVRDLNTMTNESIGYVLPFNGGEPGPGDAPDGTWSSSTRSPTALSVTSGVLSFEIRSNLIRNRFHLFTVVRVDHTLSV